MLHGCQNVPQVALSEYIGPEPANTTPYGLARWRGQIWFRVPTFVVVS